jgi:hypothetical protein
MRVARHLRAETVLLIAAPFVFGVWSLSLGQDANWDLRNYHWYNAYQLLDWRFHRDLAPASIQTFLSPLFDMPWFVLARWLPGAAVGVIIGAVQSANFVLLYLLARRALSGVFFPLLVAVIGVAAPSSRNLIGTTFNDLIVSIGVLGALCLAASAIQGNRPSRAMFCAGVALGIVVAGKSSGAPYAVAAVLSLAVVTGTWTEKLRLAIAMSAGGLLAGLLFLAPWCWWLYHLYGSPTFPFLNSLFHSPYTTLPDIFNPVQRPPHGMRAWLMFPFSFTRDPRLISAIGASDYRLLAGYVLIPCLLTLRWISRAAPIPPITRYLLAVAAVSYVLWAASLDIDRYMVLTAMLVPLLLVALSADLRVPLLKPLLAASLGCLIFLGGGSYERVAWSRDFAGATSPPIADPSRTLVVLTDVPLGFVVPSLPEPVTVVQLAPQLAPLDTDASAWARLVKATVDKPWKEMLGIVLTNANGDARPTPFLNVRLAWVGLGVQPSTCRTLITTMSAVMPNVGVCKLVRRDE